MTEKQKRIAELKASLLAPQIRPMKRNLPAKEDKGEDAMTNKF
jgi:hypothetical protein|tara:strand:+ start:361 stop:489 length:129 start_codon:yes stop_codon:yes gene_type:complete